jgi:hypothetical protein
MDVFDNSSCDVNWNISNIRDNRFNNDFYVDLAKDFILIKNPLDIP